MFCTNCGTEVKGKFCAECGTPVQQSSSPRTPPLPVPEEPSEGMVLHIDGIDIDLLAVVNECGPEFSGRMAAAKRLRDMAPSLSLGAAKGIMDNAYCKVFPHLAEERKAPDLPPREEKVQLMPTRNEKQELRERVEQMDREGTVYCPKCFSTSLSANKKGFGIGKAVIGAAIAGPIGLIAGNIGAKKVRVTCLKCGNQFWAGKQ